MAAVAAGLAVFVSGGFTVSPRGGLLLVRTFGRRCKGAFPPPVRVRAETDARPRFRYVGGRTFVRLATRPARDFLRFTMV